MHTSMKIFSFFLPQFHEIPENNEWWGHGFTEWTNVKTAKPYFRGHTQPKYPLNFDYYNLLNKKVVKAQTTLMTQYGLQGMIYYHYYFKGKLLLEKPAKNLLHWQDINQPFFFCWANHDWNRSWECRREILLKQEYGDIDDWEEHFQYLLPFFKDERYEKKNNMPLFMIFKTNFREKLDIFLYFDKRCRDYGFDGIYLIETFGVDHYEKKFGEKYIENDFALFKKACSCVTKDIYIREPNSSTSAYSHSLKKDLLKKVYMKIRRFVGNLLDKPFLYVLDGNKIYTKMIECSTKLPGIHGLFFEWDNTPRHKKRGYVITPPRKQLFFEYMDKIKNEEYLFVNAWNEWAEGMMLEPTEEHGYKYLEWIREWRVQNCKD